MAVLNLDELTEIRERYQDKRIVFCSGVFDLTHAGHVLFFEECKELGDILVVGIGTDAVIKRDKGDDRPILNEHLRLKMVDSLKPVDYTLFFQDPSKSNQKPYKSNTLAFLEDPLERLIPDVYAVNGDASNDTYRRELCKKLDIDFYVLDRTCPEEFNKISTSQIFEKIRSLKD